MKVTTSAVWVVRRRMAAAWALALVVSLAAAAVASWSYSHLPRPQPIEELSYYPSGILVKPSVLGQAEAAADLAWVRAVQYYGEHRQTDSRFTRMSHVFDILTTLAPSFVPAYVFGAFALAQEGADFPSAERLMLKGLEANPRSGELAFQMGFLYYVRPGGRDLRKAAELFEQAARLPDGPPHAARFAAFARQHSGDLMVAYELWERVRQTSHNLYLRELAEREIAQIQEAVASGHKERAVRRVGTPAALLVPGR